MIPGIHVGTSGWSYKHWKELFYPKGLKPAEWLVFYASRFSVTEINSSFYRLPGHDTVINWTTHVPPGFRFCAKMSRFLTHMKKLIEPEESLERFFEVFEPMKQMMGPVLIQLPPFLKFSYDRAAHLYHVLKKNYSQYDFVMEVRHDTWLHDDSLTLMTQNDIGLVITQSGGAFPYSEQVTAKNIYVRFHGPAQLYASSYTDEMLLSFAGKFITWQQEGHEVWVFFNNDIHAFAIHDALRLIGMLEK